MRAAGPGLFARSVAREGATMGAMTDAPSSNTRTELALLPGRLVVLFLVRVGPNLSALCERPARFLDGLHAACALMSFSELWREDERLDELLPWAGNV
jgi:hypothetical protein